MCPSYPEMACQHSLCAIDNNAGSFNYLDADEMTQSFTVLHRWAQTLALLLLSGALVAQVNDARFTPSDAYSINQNFFKMPSGRTIGSTAGFAISPDGSSIWVFDRCGSNNCVGSDLDPVMQFDMDGNHLISFGANMFIRPHGLHVDRQGNVWLTDGEGPDGRDPRRDGKGHQVFKFSSSGELLLKLGKPGIAGTGLNVFNQPSAVYVAPNGDIFVGDGHGGQSNARIMKFDAQGNFIKTWGERGSGPGEFAVPPAVAMDSLGRLFVGDRGNNRIQIFNMEGDFIAEWPQFGRPSGVYIDDNDVLYVTDSSSTPSNNPGYAEGIRIASVHDGKVITFIDDPDADGTQEGVFADADGNVYGSLTGGMALRKYELP